MVGGAFVHQWFVVPSIHDSLFARLSEFRTPREAANASWAGVPIWKFPADAFRIQEIISETRPDVIVETGTYKGGSAYFYATLFDILGNGRIVTVDIEQRPNLPAHERITYLLGSSTDPAIVERIKAEIKPGERVMVCLDSDHATAHVREELRLYSPLVTVGNYLVVEDTTGSIAGMEPNEPAGAKLSVDDFLTTTTDFELVPDNRLEFSTTLNLGGWLKRVK